MIDLYRDRADLYDLLHDDQTADLAFYASVADALIPSGGAVLELGCGSGRVMEALLEQGLRVTGLDGEPAMLAAGAAAPGPLRDRRPGSWTATCAAPYLDGERFDLVVVAVNTFMHLEDHAAQRACLQGIYAHLEESGTAVLDLANPFHALALAPRRRDPAAPGARRRDGARGDGDGLARGRSHGSARRRPLVLRRVDGRWDAAAPLGAVELRLVFMPELELLLAAAGLGIADAYGDYELGPYHGAAERMIAIVRRYPDANRSLLLVADLTES